MFSNLAPFGLPHDNLSFSASNPWIHSHHVDLIIPASKLFLSLFFSYQETSIFLLQTKRPIRCNLLTCRGAICHTTINIVDSVFITMTAISWWQLCTKLCAKAGLWPLRTILSIFQATKQSWSSFVFSWSSNMLILQCKNKNTQM